METIKLNEEVMIHRCNDESEKNEKNLIFTSDSLDTENGKYQEPEDLSTSNSPNVCPKLERKSRSFNGHYRSKHEYDTNDLHKKVDQQSSPEGRKDLSSDLELKTNEMPQDLSQKATCIDQLIDHAAFHRIPITNALILLGNIPNQLRRQENVHKSSSSVVNEIVDGRSNSFANRTTAQDVPRKQLSDTEDDTKSRSFAVNELADRFKVKSDCKTEIQDSQYALGINTECKSNSNSFTDQITSEDICRRLLSDTKDGTKSNDSSIKMCTSDLNRSVHRSDDGDRTEGYKDADPNLFECFLTESSEDKEEIHIQEKAGNHSMANQNEAFCRICKKTFKDSNSRQRHIEHMNSVHEIAITNKKYHCLHCNKLFYTYKSFKLHKQIKAKCSESLDFEKRSEPSATEFLHEDIFVKCHICYESFSNMRKLNFHCQTIHGDEIGKEDNEGISYKCKKCIIVFPSLRLLREHFFKHHSAHVFRCSSCHVALANKDSLRLHYKNTHEDGVEKPLCCDKCGMESVNLKALKNHVRLKHDSLAKHGFQCRLCEEKFDTKEARKLHYESQHTGESPYLCKDCGRGFSSRSGLYGHRQQHKTKQPSTCQYCGKIFSRRDSYHEHVLIHVGPRHRCPHCPKEFVQRSNLVRHIRIHTGQKPYSCTFCEKRFSDKGACTSHIRVHTKEEQCSCPYCGQSFTKKQKLKYHMRKHTGEGLVSCEVCSKAFTNSFALKEHRAIHDRGTRITCTECGKAFNSNKYLQRHMVIVHPDPNSRLVALQCPLCKKVFSQKTKLKSHIMTHAQKNHLQCLICEKRYSVMKSIQNHLQKFHDIQADQPSFKTSIRSLFGDNGNAISIEKPIDNLLCDEKNLANFAPGNDFYAFALRGADEIIDRELSRVENLKRTKEIDVDTVLNLTNTIESRSSRNLLETIHGKIVPVTDPLPFVKSETGEEIIESADIRESKYIKFSATEISNNYPEKHGMVSNKSNCEKALNLVKLQTSYKCKPESSQADSTKDSKGIYVLEQQLPNLERETIERKGLKSVQGPSKNCVLMKESTRLDNRVSKQNRVEDNNVPSNDIQIKSKPEVISCSSLKPNEIQKSSFSQFEVIGNRRKYHKKPKKYVSPVVPLIMSEDELGNVVPKMRRVEAISLLLTQTTVLKESI